jgi:hypothetical protein
MIQPGDVYTVTFDPSKGWNPSAWTAPLRLSEGPYQSSYYPVLAFDPSKMKGICVFSMPDDEGTAW